MYGALVLKTFTRYGEAMDRTWEKRFDEWTEELSANSVYGRSLSPSGPPHHTTSTSPSDPSEMPYSGNYSDRPPSRHAPSHLSQDTSRYPPSETYHSEQSPASTGVESEQTRTNTVQNRRLASLPEDDEDFYTLPSAREGKTDGNVTDFSLNTTTRVPTTHNPPPSPGILVPNHPIENLPPTNSQPPLEHSRLEHRSEVKIEAPKPREGIRFLSPIISAARDDINLGNFQLNPHDASGGRAPSTQHSSWGLSPTNFPTESYASPQTDNITEDRNPADYGQERIDVQ